MEVASDMEDRQPPTDNEIKEYVEQFLECADLQMVTMKDVCNKVYSHYPDFDLAHKKDFIKATVKLVINNEPATAQQENLVKSLQNLQLYPQSPLENNPDIAAGRNNGFAQEEFMVKSLQNLQLNPHSPLEKNPEIAAELEETVNRTPQSWPQYHQDVGASTDMKDRHPPTDEEIKEYVKQFLECADLEVVTMKDVCNKVYSHYPDFDLAHKKDFIKAVVKSCI